MFSYSQAERLSLSWLRTGYLHGVFEMLTDEEHERLKSLGAAEKKQFLREIHRWISGDPKAEKPVVIIRDTIGFARPRRTDGAGTTHELLSIFTNSEPADSSS